MKINGKSFRRGNGVLVEGLVPLSEASERWQQIYKDIFAGLDSCADPIYCGGLGTDLVLVMKHKSLGLWVLYETTNRSLVFKMTDRSLSVA